jgi:hypothetical protein
MDALVPVVIGVILGWGLTSLSNWWQEQRREVEQQKRELEERQHVRMLLRLETQHNVKELVDFWAKASSNTVRIPGVGVLAGIGYAPDELQFGHYQQLALEPLPEWSYLMWESQASLVAKALNPLEIDPVYAHYADLKTFTARQQGLREMLVETSQGMELSKLFGQYMQQKQREPGYAMNQALRDGLNYFNIEAQPYWSECQAIYSRQRPYQDQNLIEADAPIPRWRDQLRPPHKAPDKPGIRADSGG